MTDATDKALNNVTSNTNINKTFKPQNTNLVALY